MIQLINNAKQLNLNSASVLQRKNTTTQYNQSQMISPYSKEYANASRSLALASINMNRTQTPSFKGEKMTELPKGWFFDAEKLIIRDNYGVTRKISDDDKKALRALSNDDFKAYMKVGEKSVVPFYRYTPTAVKGTEWMPDGFVAVREDGNIEYVSWKEFSEQFDDN
ncbi:MAG: hypothetical protein IJY61_09170 [Candidatus Gastranaerophilales bacterium]|nr:hypothetical protein [Candidatus Gastranaerophilales bacterium]